MRNQPRRSGRPRRRPETNIPPEAASPVPDERPVRPQKERLQKVLAAAGIGSRRACEEYIVLGRVAVDGRVVTELGTVVDPETQRIAFDGEEIRLEPKVYWWVNKPPGVLCTSRDTHGRATVLDLVPGIGERVYCVGRLDEESLGLLLLTNDGELAQKLTHPRYQIPKTYECLVAGRITGETMDKMREGVWLSDGKARVKDIHRLGTHGTATRIRVILCEGHNREIRRLFAKFGHKVMRLERTAIGPLKIRKLRVGEARPATEEEVALLRRLCRRTSAPRPSAGPKPKRAPRQEVSEQREDRKTFAPKHKKPTRPGGKRSLGPPGLNKRAGTGGKKKATRDRSRDKRRT
ncbi:MAG: pseudouridine synthase [Planctomycetota bacterium]